MNGATDAIHVLYVDDDSGLAEMVVTFLERADDRIVVRTATNAAEGLDRLADETFDCIVSDYDMPGRNGIGFLKAVRKTAPELPFILYTGKGSEEIASDAISAGVTDYLQKERGTDQYAILANRIRNVVTKARAEREREQMRERMELALEHTNSVIFEIDLETGEVIRHGAFKQFFEQSPDAVPTWKDHLEHVVHPDDREEFRAFYHQLIDGDRETGTLEYRTNPDSGPVRWIEDTISLKTDTADGTPLGVGIARDITEYKERERELRRKERRYQAVFNDPNILVGLIDTDGTVLDINHTAIEYIDATREEVTGQPFWETPWFAHSASLRREVKDWIDRAAGGEYVEFEADLVRPDGDPYTIEGVFRPVTNDDGDVVSLLISDRDITEQKVHERELERIYEFFTEAERLGDLGAWEFDETGNAVWTDGTRRIHEVGDEFEPTVEAGLEFYHPADRTKVKQAVESALASGEPYDLQVRLITAEGNERWVRTRGKPIDDTSHHAIRGYIQDITDRKHREQELERYREYTDRVFDAINDVFFVHDENGDIQRWNDSVPAVTGYSDAEIASMKGIDFIPEAAHERTEAAIQQVFETGHATLEAPLVTKDGTTIPYEFAADRVEHPNGEMHLVGIGRDIRERKERERKLERTREQMEFALDVTDSIIWTIDLDTGDSTEWGPVERLFGTEPDGLDDFVANVVHPADRARVTRLFAEIEAGDRDEFDVEFRTVSDTGETTWVASTGYFREDADEPRTRLIGLATDVTDRIRREKELQRQNERLAEFASVVSHDLRNPLQVADGRLELARADCDSDHLDDVAGALDRMDALIEDLLTLARQGDTVTTREPVDIAAVAESCWANVETAEAALLTDVESAVQADESRLKQLFENLIHNAVEHGGDDVTITVGDLDDGFYVEDDGQGIPEEERAEVFEAGYSTLPDGTGFGLHIVQQVVEAHNWEVCVTESANGGARFEITGIQCIG